MYWGNAFARRAFAPLLEKKYPRALFFNIFNGKFETFGDFLDPSSIFLKYDRLYFLRKRRIDERRQLGENPVLRFEISPGS